MSNRIQDLLIRLGICGKTSFRKIAGRVRDRKDVSVLRCERSSVIILNTTRHISEKDYLSQDDFTYWSASDLHSAKVSEHEDTLRRAEGLRPLIANKRWLDFGAGSGGQLEYLKGFAAESYGVELQSGARKHLNQEDYKVYKSIEEVPPRLDVVTLYHVFEHLLDPVKTLEAIRKRMRKGGKIVIEVPHANDILLSFYDLDAFKKFTFWSQHLILHTRESLAAFIRAADFKNVVIKGVQRYPLSNHLHWLAKNAPGGHVKWDFLNTPELKAAYGDLLASIDKTDTLVAYGEK